MICTMYGKKKGLNTMRGYGESSNTCCSMAKGTGHVTHAGEVDHSARVRCDWEPYWSTSPGLVVLWLCSGEAGSGWMQKARTSMFSASPKRSQDPCGRHFQPWSHGSPEGWSIEKKKGNEKTRLERIAERVAPLLSCILLHNCIQMRWLNTGRDVEKGSPARQVGRGRTGCPMPSKQRRRARRLGPAGSR